MREFKLYRGFKDSFTPGEFPNPYLVTPRHPLNTPLGIHLESDDWFSTQFGCRFRSEALFCYGSTKYASDYGRVGTIEPVGAHLLCWSPSIVDLYGSYMEAPATCSVGEILLAGDYRVFTLDNVSLVERAIESDHEIMLWCRSYRVHVVK